MDKTAVNNGWLSNERSIINPEGSYLQNASNFSNDYILPAVLFNLSALPDILQKCSAELTRSYPSYANLSTQEQIHSICDYCILPEEQLSVLYSDQTCLKTQYYPMPVFGVLFGLVVLLGALGNVLVLSSVLTGGRNLSSVVHLFIINLAMGDLLMLVLCVPFTVTSVMVLHYWPFGHVLCVGVSYLQGVSVFVSAYSLVAISFDRYVAIIYPLRPRITRFQAKLSILVVWAMASLTCIPIAIYSTLKIPDEGYHAYNELLVCYETWPDGFDNFRKSYSLGLVTLHYFLPVTVMIVTYSRIAWRVWGSQESQTVRASHAHAQLTSTPSGGTGTLPRNLSFLGRTGAPPPTGAGQSPKKMIRMTVTVVMVYSLCWLPFNVLMVVQEYNKEVHYMKGFHYLWATCYWLAMTHAVFNIMLLYWLNISFRVALLRLLCRLLPSCCQGPLLSRLRFLPSSRYNRRFHTGSLGWNCTLLVQQDSLAQRNRLNSSQRSSTGTRSSSLRTTEESSPISSMPHSCMSVRPLLSQNGRDGLHEIQEVGSELEDVQVQEDPFHLLEKDHIHCDCDDEKDHIDCDCDDVFLPDSNPDQQLQL